MFISILRIGPLVILESILLAIAIVIYFIGTLPRCYQQTLSQLAFLLFLVETFASLRIIKQSGPLRRVFIKGRIQERKGRYYTKLLWDLFNLISIVLMLYWAVVADGLTMTDPTPIGQPPSGHSEKQCEFVLFSICLFGEMIKGCSFSDEDSMIAWMLYAVTAFLITLICVAVAKEYYQYWTSLKHNRRFVELHGSMQEAMLDCAIFRVSQASTLNDSLRETLGECSICLDGLLGQQEIREGKIVKLSCKHNFHEECISRWLKVKDHCPYRCFQEAK